MATPNEIQIFKIIRRHGKASSREVGELMGISQGYAGFLMTTMVDRGWLSREKRAGYILTPVGVDAFINEFLYARESLETKVARMSVQIGRIDEEIIKLESLKNGMEKERKVMN